MRKSGLGLIKKQQETALTRDEVWSILCSDLHLSEKSPLFRSCEKDWYAVQANYLAQLNSLAVKYKCPILAAGDIFDRWSCKPELINFCLKHLPTIYAVPGNHDLRHGSLKDIEVTAYWSMVLAGRIINIVPDCPLPVGSLTLYGFPEGIPVKPCLRPLHDLGLHIALVHSYIWIKNRSYPGAPLQKRLGNMKGKFEGYDAVVVGDNHQSFLVENVLNCGGFMRRKSDERDYKPSVGLLHSDGKITRHYLDISKDKVLDIPVELAVLEDTGLTDFLDQLANLQSDSLDFKVALEEWMNKNEVEQGVKKVILQALENK